jgi:hypothetical protein
MTTLLDEIKISVIPQKMRKNSGGRSDRDISKVLQLRALPCPPSTLWDGFFILAHLSREQIMIAGAYMTLEAVHQDPKPRPRKDFDKVVFWERYEQFTSNGGYPPTQKATLFETWMNEWRYPTKLIRA